jgi:hypothetical protein
MGSSGTVRIDFFFSHELSCSFIYTVKTVNNP